MQRDLPGRGVDFLMAGLAVKQNLVYLCIVEFRHVVLLLPLFRERRRLAEIIGVLSASNVGTIHTDIVSFRRRKVGPVNL